MNNILELLNKYYPQFDEDLKQYIASKALVKEFKSGDEMMRSGQYLKSTMLCFLCITFNLDKKVLYHLYVQHATKKAT
jgi:hypothetical protein